MFISNQEAIPVIETDIFEKNKGNPLAIARVRTEDVLSGDNPVALGYSQLRANVYIDQTGMLDSSYRREDGGEDDVDDGRSIHFVGLEDRGNGTAAVTAAMRLIYKSFEHSEALPIEELFAKELEGTSAPSGSFEVSRYISKNENRRHAILSKLAIIGSGLAHAVEHQWGPCFAVVEPPIESDLDRLGVPVVRIAEPRYIPEYNDINVGIEINLTEHTRRLGARVVKSLYIEDDAVRFFGGE